MTSRLRSRVEAAEAKANVNTPDNSFRQFYVKGDNELARVVRMAA